MLEDFGLVPTTAGHGIKPGDRFGRLEVLAVGQTPGAWRYFAVVRCDCGSPVKKTGTQGLANGTTLGCGCVRRDRTITHDLTGHPHIVRWKAMMARCYHPDATSYPRYGAKGIRVCKRWHDPHNFIADLPPGFKPGMQLDRIDGKKGYSPGNVRWATARENSLNRSSVRMYEHDGRAQCVADWARETGIKYATLKRRLDKGWSVQRALGEPTKPRSRTLTHDGRTQSIRDWAHELGVQYDTLLQRLAAGWSTERALTEPSRSGGRMLTHEGRTRSIADWAQALGIKYETLTQRLANGWSVERALGEATAPIARMLTHDGRTMSMTDWAQELGIKYPTLRKRLDTGWSVACALSTPTRKKNPE